jgi:hypothetical protein
VRWPSIWERLQPAEQRGVDLWNGRTSTLEFYHNRGHSTLLVNDSEQVVTGRATIPEFSADPTNAFAVVDLSPIYAGQLAGSTRRFQLLSDRSVLIEDRLLGEAQPATVRWGMVTDAVLKNDGGRQAWLEDGNPAGFLKSPPRGAVHSLANPPPRADAPNRRQHRRLTVSVAAGVGRSR